MPPNEIKARLNRLEEALDKHLQESGEIRTDLAWLKRSFWALAGAGLTFNCTLVIYILTASK